ncbi:hypothetical protein E7811_12155 [Aliigemmobacter aestuarii]|uniref:Uncharacterized protein n=1 Tax=Aliigemmobacter aestuarii TaxID=1445661 RepID=A0A4S3ML17_9RHOB|nr:hypothetical protein [Gemmobacter aestuarii]THD82898.1 hypothetical protein E7811_12155 [Gemmobacter aestuarii]
MSLPALEARLAALAAEGRTVTYGQLARDLGWRMAELTAALEALMEADAERGAPLRAALCEGRLAGGMPARGFFDKAAALGIDIRDPEGFVAAQRTALFKRGG